jgi:Ser/Thr protein kinase RdoA (MazF antagonist)
MNDESWHELLAFYPAATQPRSRFQSLGGAGGLSGSRLWRFRADCGELLLREWPLHGHGRAHIEQVHEWLFLLADLKFVPVPFRDRAGASVVEWRDTLWEVTPWLVGSPDRLCPPRRDHLELAFGGLAALHARWASLQVVGTSAGLLQRHREVDELVRRGFARLEMAINGRGDDDRVIRHDALRWLTLARTLAPRLLEPLERATAQVVRVQPVIRDARPEHFLFDDTRLSGLVDFGAMGVDSVAGDLARLLGEWSGDDDDARRHALAAYERFRPLDPIERALVAVFEAGTGLLIGERWVRWHYVERRHFDHPQAIASGLARGLRHLNRLAQSKREWEPTF